MLQKLSTINETASRAKEFKLEKIIEDLAGEKEPRVVSKKQIEDRRTILYQQIDNPVEAGIRLERILQGNELTDISYLAQGIICSKSVARIIIKKGGRLVGYGTGSLIAPGVLLTNHHVLPDFEYVQESTAQFRYERDIYGNELNPIDFKLKITPEPILCKDLDIALVGVELISADHRGLDQFRWLKLNPQPKKAFIGEYLTIIQHPNGEHKQICVRENKLLKYLDNSPYIWYQTDTVGGSSGSPVFNNSWEVVALHHSSAPQTKRINGKDVYVAKNGKVWTPDMGDDQINWIANEGIRISQILLYLNENHPNNLLVQQVLNVTEPPKDQIMTENLRDIGGLKIKNNDSGGTTIFVPIDINMQVGLKETIKNYALPTSSIQKQFVLNSVPLIEKVEIDQDNYNERKGYDPKYLGNNFEVPLPKVRTKKFGKVLLFQGKKKELKYWNYSVVMNSERKLAYFSAANVDSGNFRGNRDADGDTWFKDTRIPEEVQIGKEYYKKQKEFEADRLQNPFDQGHLTRRKDLQWGKNDKEAKRNGDDSFHYTNCSPQHWRFNQNSKGYGIWFRLEESALKTLSSGAKLCIINGPVFNAPLSTITVDGEPKINFKGESKDGSFGGEKIPKQFFKVIAYKKGGKLLAKAFVVSQENLLTTIDRYYPAEAAVLTDEEVRLYQVRIADLEKLTNLDFGNLSAADLPKVEESIKVKEGLPIQDESEIIF